MWAYYKSWNVFLVFLYLLTLFPLIFALKEGDCEVCVSVVQKFSDSLDDKVKQSTTEIEDKFRKFCEESKGKENRFCYYIGGLEESATSIIGELSKPVSWGMPALKVCEKLMKKDSQICDLRYDKTYDMKTVDLKKLRVRDLKKILDGWGEICDGCLEKTDFIKRIDELKPLYVKDEL